MFGCSMAALPGSSLRAGNRIMYPESSGLAPDADLHLGFKQATASPQHEPPNLKSLYTGVSHNWGYLTGGPHNEDYSILGSILGSPHFRKLPYPLTEILGSAMSALRCAC